MLALGEEQLSNLISSMSDNSGNSSFGVNTILDEHLPPTPESCLDDLDSLLSLSGPLGDGGIESFTNLLQDPKLTNDGGLVEDSQSDSSSDADSGYRTSPSASPEMADIHSWLTNSIPTTASNDQLLQLLPPIDTMIPATNTNMSQLISIQSPNVTQEANLNILDLLCSMENSAANSPPLILTPPTTPSVFSTTEQIQIKAEPMDIISTPCNNTVPTTPDEMPPLIAANALKLNQPKIQPQLSPATSPHSKTTPSGGEHCSSEDLMRLKFSPHVLPPCRVCGAQATGYHYGANTCEPCKGFYHRMTKRADKNLVCLKQKNCVITAKNRGACPACRFQKCLDAGMAKGNIKTGRYSYSKRSRDIIELQKSLSAKQQLQQQDLQQEQEQQLALQMALAHSAAFSTQTVTSLVQQVREERVMEDDAVSAQILVTLKAARDKIISRMMNTKLELSSEQQTAIQNFTKHLDSEDHSLAYSSFLQWVNLGFKHNFWSSYVKAIPGFKKLNMQDQINIIKKCFIDFWIVARHRLFDVDSSTFYGMGGVVIPLQRILEESQNRALMNAVKRLQNLRLSVDESCILSAFVVLNTDNSEMQDPSAVEELRMKLMHALMYTLKQNRPRPLSSYAQIISALTEIKSAMHNVHLHMAQLPENVTPSLFREILLSMES